MYQQNKILEGDFGHARERTKFQKVSEETRNYKAVPPLSIMGKLCFDNIYWIQNYYSPNWRVCNIFRHRRQHRQLQSLLMAQELGETADSYLAYRCSGGAQTMKWYRK